MVAVSTSPPHGTVIIVGCMESTSAVGEMVMKAVNETGCAIVMTAYPDNRTSPTLLGPVTVATFADVGRLCEKEPEPDVYAKTCPRCGGSRRSAFNPRKPCGRCGGSGSL